jgi:hypothetical protein
MTLRMHSGSVYPARCSANPIRICHVQRDRDFCSSGPRSTASNGPTAHRVSHHFNCAFEEDFTLIVEAPDEKAAELMAAKIFMLNEWQRKRLLVRKHP